MTKKNNFGKAHHYDNIKLSDIYNDIKQVRKKTAQKDIDKIVDSIKAIGQQTPIGVCYSEITKGSDQYEYHLIYGQKRMLAMATLGIEEIEAKIYTKPEIWSQQQILIEAFAENYADTEMDKGEVWDVIQELYYAFNKNIKKVQTATGLRYEDIRDAVKRHEIEKKEGGPELLAHAINFGEFGDKDILDIIEPCLIDNNTINVSKAIKFHDALVKVDPPKRKNVYKVAKEFRDVEVETWITDGENIPLLKGRTIRFELSDDAKIEEYAKSLGLSWTDYVESVVLDSIKVDVDISENFED